jgi:hypothetical protein
MFTFNLRVECVGRRFELVAASRIAEADDLAAIERQAVRAYRLTGPRAAFVDAIFEAQVAGQSLGLLRQLLGLRHRLFDAADHVEGALREVVVFAFDH